MCCEYKQIDDSFDDVKTNTQTETIVYLLTAWPNILYFHMEKKLNIF
jgi:hypothetical protein